MKKLMMIICDGMDYEYTYNHLKDLPFINNLYKEGKFNCLKSVVPADSVPSWSTIYTGMNPCEHGVLESIDYLNAKDNLQGDYSWIKGKVFWDKISNQGKKVLVVNPFMAYPAWNVNGLMVSGPVFEGGEITTNNKELIKNFDIPAMGGITDYPNKKQMKSFYEKTFNTTCKQFEFFDKCMGTDKYDFAFLGILTLDRMQHFLWRYTDPTDVTYVKKTDLHDSILSTYKLIDEKISKLYEKYSNEYDLLVISDHGHGKRCEKTFYINRWLIVNGFIPNKSFKKRTIEHLKNSVLNFLFKIRCISKGTNFFKKFKFLHKVKNADYGEKKQDIKAIYVPNFNGVNPFGGIKVDKSSFESIEKYNQTINDIINKLKDVKDGNECIVEWVKTREEIYIGEKENIYPEIIFKLNNNYGVDRGLYGNRLFGKSYFHEIISGGHRWDGVIISNQINELKSAENIFDYIMEYYI